MTRDCLQIRYAHDCKALYGKILGAPVPEARYMVLATETTVQLWKKHFPTEPYHHVGVAKTCEEIFPWRSKISYDLADAVLRQSSFYYQVRAGSLYPEVEPASLQRTSILSRKLNDDRRVVS